MDTVTVRRETVEVQVVIKYDVVTKQYSIEGCDENPIIAWGMLEYTLSRLRRVLAQADLRQQLENAPQIVLGSQVPQ